ncbi:hypothetical protein HMPREF9123_1479 [Neisseria bacilliformis ATCC BAA-1200]|uniref:Uncharacterized protein n=1 Tax=Neisseria bacilliformis ATCC BAA-1200 TaxID=888742 RepID=F2BCQ4_9NEIS|nr:hypothetical protein HMPREF9123_1479 [Neisseria bacilliformis ATCC BAA-1200]
MRRCFWQKHRLPRQKCPQVSTLLRFFPYIWVFFTQKTTRKLNVNRP